METQEMLALPNLRMRAPLYKMIPRRYEETRPVVIQSFTHDRILNMGNEIERKTQERCSHERRLAVATREAAVWAEAEVIKAEAIKVALNKSQLHHERLVKKLNKAHEHKLKEELAHLANELERVRRDDCEKMKQQCKREEEEAIRKSEQKCEQEKVFAVASARQQEKELAAQQLYQQATMLNKQMEAALKESADDKVRCLNDLTSRKDAECKSSVAIARQEEQKICSDKLRHLKEVFEQQIHVLHSHIDVKRKEIQQLEAELAQLKLSKGNVFTELTETHQAFQDFIEVVKPFNNPEAKYVLPPPKSLCL